MNPSPSGKVFLCCVSTNQESVGDVNENTLEEIFNGEKIKAIRKQMADGQQPGAPVSRSACGRAGPADAGTLDGFTGMAGGPEYPQRDLAQDPGNRSRRHDEESRDRADADSTDAGQAPGVRARVTHRGWLLGRQLRGASRSRMKLTP